MPTEIQPGTLLQKIDEANSCGIFSTNNSNNSELPIILICIGLLIILIPKRYLFNTIGSRQTKLSLLFSIGGILIWLLNLNNSVSKSVPDVSIQRLGHIIDMHLGNKSSNDIIQKQTNQTENDTLLIGDTNIVPDLSTNVNIPEPEYKSEAEKIRDKLRLDKTLALKATVAANIARD